MTPPPIIANAGPLLARYDAVFCDVWGVVHNGRQAYAEAGEALARFRAGGGTVVLVSNAPVPADGRGARAGAHRRASRRLGRHRLLGRHRARPHRRAGLPAPPPHRSRQARQPPVPAPAGRSAALLHEADAIVCTGLVDDANETVETYRALIEEGVARALPFVCANPDLVVDVGEQALPVRRQHRAEYERHGGAVFWAGKPHPSAYDAALRCAAELRGAEPPRATHPRHRRRRCAPISQRRRAWASTPCSSPRASTTARC